MRSIVGVYRSEQPYVASRKFRNVIFAERIAAVKNADNETQKILLTHWLVSKISLHYILRVEYKTLLRLPIADKS